MQHAQFNATLDPAPDALADLQRQVRAALDVPAATLGPSSPPLENLRSAVVAVEQMQTKNPDAVIDMLIMHHDAVGSYGHRDDTPHHRIACQGAEGDGPTPSCALHAWIIRARYMLVEAVL